MVWPRGECEVFRGPNVSPSINNKVLDFAHCFFRWANIHQQKNITLKNFFSLQLPSVYLLLSECSQYCIKILLIYSACQFEDTKVLCIYHLYLSHSSVLDG